MVLNKEGSSTNSKFDINGNNSPVSLDMWNYGAEAWCNMEGRYVTLVVSPDPAYLGQYTLSICSLGVMGVKYIRDNPPPTRIEIKYFGDQTITIENIYAQERLGNTLSIHLRQKPGSEHAFVTLTQGSPTQVHIAAA